MMLKFKNIIFTAAVIAAIILFAGSAFAQNNFVGKLKMKVSNGKQKATYITYYFQNGKMRADLPESAMGGKTYMILRDKSMYVVIPSQKMYMKYSGSYDKLMNTKFPMEADSSTGDSKGQKADWKHIWKKGKTGNTKSILGYNCVEYVFQNDGGGSMHFWVTKELGNLSLMQNPMSPNPMLNLINKMGGFFPLLTVDYGANGKIVSKIEVVQIKKQKLDEVLFALPAGFKEMKLPGIN